MTACLTHKPAVVTAWFTIRFWIGALLGDKLLVNASDLSENIYTDFLFRLQSDTRRTLQLWSFVPLLHIAV
jgi:hypothetical protein